MTRSRMVIAVKTMVNSVPLKKPYLETLNQYLNNILNGHSIQFLKLSVQNVEENITSLPRVQVNFQAESPLHCLNHLSEC